MDYDSGPSSLPATKAETVPRCDKYKRQSSYPGDQTNKDPLPYEEIARPLPHNTEISINTNASLASFQTTADNRGQLNTQALVGSASGTHIPQIQESSVYALQTSALAVHAQETPPHASQTIETSALATSKQESQRHEFGLDPDRDTLVPSSCRATGYHMYGDTVSQNSELAVGNHRDWRDVLTMPPQDELGAHGEIEQHEQLAPPGLEEYGEVFVEIWYNQRVFCLKIRIGNTMGQLRCHRTLAALVGMGQERFYLDGRLVQWNERIFSSCVLDLQ